MTIDASPPDAQSPSHDRIPGLRAHLWWLALRAGLRGIWVALVLMALIFGVLLPLQQKLGEGPWAGAGGGYLSYILSTLGIDAPALLDSALVPARLSLVALVFAAGLAVRSGLQCLAGLRRESPALAVLRALIAKEQPEAILRLGRPLRRTYLLPVLAPLLVVGMAAASIYHPVTVPRLVAIFPTANEDSAVLLFDRPLWGFSSLSVMLEVDQPGGREVQLCCMTLSDVFAQVALRMVRAGTMCQPNSLVLRFVDGGTPMPIPEPDPDPGMPEPMLSPDEPVVISSPPFSAQTTLWAERVDPDSVGAATVTVWRDGGFARGRARTEQVVIRDDLAKFEIFEIAQQAGAGAIQPADMCLLYGL